MTEFAIQKRLQLGLTGWNASSDRRAEVITKIASNPILSRNYTPIWLSNESQLLLEQLANRVRRLAGSKPKRQRSSK